MKLRLPAAAWRGAVHIQGGSASAISWFATDWFRSETVMSVRDSSRRLSRFGEVGWEPSSQAPMVAHSEWLVRQGSYGGTAVAVGRRI